MINVFGWMIVVSINVNNAMYVNEKVNIDKSCGGIFASRKSYGVAPCLTSRLETTTLQYLNKIM